MKDFHAEDVFHERNHDVPLLQDVVLDPDRVADYLRQHPDFFIDYDYSNALKQNFQSIAYSIT